MSEEVQQSMLRECQGYDFIRFTAADIHGLPRLRAVSKRSVQKYLKEGAPLFEGSFIMGPASELYKFSCGTNNVNMKPMPGTFYPLPWATEGKHKVGEFLCEPCILGSGEFHGANTRTIARQQLQRLADMGLSLTSGSELEFILVDKETKSKPIADKPSYVSATGHAPMESFLYTVDNLLFESGIMVDIINEEYAAGQYEFALAPTSGIDGADQVFKFRQAVRELALQNDMFASFMSMPFLGLGNGCHFNFSVKDEHGNNMFYDESKSDVLSEFAKYWIAGILKHAKALSALCGPTVNCFRRYHTAWAPDKINWGLDDRFATLRVKNNGKEGTYLENRLPSGASNPYLVMAGTIAAGLDGVNSKLVCPPPVYMDQVEDGLSDTFAEALAALKSDKVMTTALGDKFMEVFTAEKEIVELAAFPDWDRKDNSDEAFKKERKAYMECM